MKIPFSIIERVVQLILIMLYLVMCAFLFLYVYSETNNYKDPRIIILSLAIMYGVLRVYGIFFWPKIEIKNNRLYVYKPGWKLYLGKSFPLEKVRKVRIVKKSDGFGSFLTNESLTIEAGNLNSDQISQLSDALNNMSLEIENKIT